MKAKSLYKTISDFDKNMKTRCRLLSNRVRNSEFRIKISIIFILFLTLIQCDQHLKSSRIKKIHGGTLHLYQLPFSTLSPGRTKSFYEFFFVNQIFEGLIEYYDDLNLLPGYC